MSIPAELPVVSAEAAGEAAPLLRLLPAIAPGESARKRRGFAILAGVIVVGCFLVLLRFWLPSPGVPGIDENAYMVGGKNLAQHLTVGMRPAEPYAYVGIMWVWTKSGWYYPKYPLGVPVLNALAIWIGGRDAAYLVSPICMTAAVAGMFLFGRAVAGSLAGLLAMILMACNPTALQLAHIPSSHAPAVGFVVWGMYLILRWWREGRIWQGIAGGFLLGFAVTIRYSEALLLFPLYPLDLIDKQTHPAGHVLFYAVRFLPIGPLGLAVVASVRWRQWRSYLRAAVPLVAWGAPVGALVAFNWITLHTLTGYDPTHESTGFTWAEFLRKWEFTIQQFCSYGLFLIAPLGLAGLGLIYRRSWRLGLYLTLWLGPGAALYTAYYWGNDLAGTAFLRFFLTLYPPVIVGAVWALSGGGFPTGMTGQAGKPAPQRSVAVPLTAGLLVAGSALIGIYTSLPDLERQHRINSNMNCSANIILSQVRNARGGPRGQESVVFADGGFFPMLLQYVQFRGDCEWYAADAFDRRTIGGYGFAPEFGQRAGDGDDKPTAFDPERAAYLRTVVADRQQPEIYAEQRRIIESALAQGRSVYGVLPPYQVPTYKDRMREWGLETRELIHWSEPLDVKFDKPGALSPPRNILSMLVRWTPQKWDLVEIRKASGT